MFSRKWTTKSTGSFSKRIDRVAEALEDAQAVIIGAGAGLSAAGGPDFAYSGERFDRLFGDFAQKYHFADMYSGGFYPYQTPEEMWAFWSRYIWYNRYDCPVGKPYQDLLSIVEGRDYFVLTTNVDHQFQRAGFDKGRLFYTQGDYGLWQCSKPCHNKTYDNYEVVKLMVEEQRDMRVPTELVPHCPRCGEPMSMNLRSDDTFVEDEGWHRASARYTDFVRRHEGLKTVYLELGVGGNTPGIIKYPFWQFTAANNDSLYVQVSYHDAIVPYAIEHRSVIFDEGAAGMLEALRKRLSR